MHLKSKLKESDDEGIVWSGVYTVLDNWLRHKGLVVCNILHGKEQ